MTPGHIRLRHDRVIVKRLPIPKETKGGIYLPLKAIELPQLAHIVLIGPKNPDGLQPGDLVLIKKFEGQRIFIFGEEHHLMFIEDLLAVIKD